MKILVSGYDVLLPDENRMSEIVVDFPGPQDSPYVGVSNLQETQSYMEIDINTNFFPSTGYMESESLVTGLVPDKVSINWIPEQDLPPKYRWGVSL